MICNKILKVQQPLPGLNLQLKYKISLQRCLERVHCGMHPEITKYIILGNTESSNIHLFSADMGCKIKKKNET